MGDRAGHFFRIKGHRYLRLRCEFCESLEFPNTDQWIRDQNVIDSRCNHYFCFTDFGDRNPARATRQL
jgi:hypothetical protein